MQVNSRNKQYLVDLDKNKKDYYEFLKEKGLSDNTLYNYKNLLRKIEGKQECVNPNIPIEKYSFDEIIELLKEMQPTSQKSAKMYVAFLMDYFKFLRKKKILPENMLVIGDLTKGEFTDKIIDKRSQYQQFVTENQIYNEITKLKNPQDQAIILLQFEGIRGKANIDLINLLNKDINLEKKTINYICHETGEIKTLKMNEKLTEIVKKAMNQEYYINANGKQVANSTSPFFESLYFIKPTKAFKTAMNQKKKPNRNNKVLSTTVQYRTRKCLKDYLGINNQQVTPLGLYKSGVLTRAVKYSVSEYFDIMNTLQFNNYLMKYENMNRDTAYSQYDEYIQMFDMLLEDIVE